MTMFDASCPMAIFLGACSGAAEAIIAKAGVSYVIGGFVLGVVIGWVVYFLLSGEALDWVMKFKSTESTNSHWEINSDLYLLLLMAIPFIAGFLSMFVVQFVLL